MVSYQEFRQMVIDRLESPGDETTLFVNRLIAYADELVDIVLDPPPNPPSQPPILPDIEPDPKPIPGGQMVFNAGKVVTIVPKKKKKHEGKPKKEKV